MKTTLVEMDSSQEAKTAHAFADTRWPLAFGSAIIALLFGGVGVWAATTQIAGAIIAAGTVVVDSNVKKVQHAVGGSVGAILVKEGDAVETGQLLLRLDDTLVRANAQVLSKQLDEVAVRRARLLAERDEKQEIAFPDELSARRTDPQLSEIVSSERALFESRRKGRSVRKGQLEERIAQLHNETAGLSAQQHAKIQELAFARDELDGLEQLDSHQLVSTPRITSARRVVAQLEGDIAQIVASVAQVRGRIAEAKLEIVGVDQDLKIEVGKELRELQARESELVERKVAADNQLSKMDIHAPQSGVVQQLAVHTVGGVVSPGEPIMLIVPTGDRLVVEAKVAPQDIDQIKIGRSAKIRFSAFNQRTTPTFPAVVTRVSADLMTDSVQGWTPHPRSASFYVIRLELDKKAQPDVSSLMLIPGMPAEIHVKTEDRTALSYLAKPIFDQFAKAFRER